MQVKIVKNQGDMTLVQWGSGAENVPTRAWVRTEDIVDGEVEHPERGVPYGMDLSRTLVLQPITAKDIVRELRKLGIWTLDDLRQNPSMVGNAISASYGVNIASVFEAANRYEETLRGEKPPPSA